MDYKIRTLIISLILILELFSACTENRINHKAEIPEDAFPIVYRSHLYIKGSADSINGNFVFDTGASNLYYDSTYFAGGNFHYSDFWNAKLPGAGKTPYYTKYGGVGGESSSYVPRAKSFEIADFIFDNVTASFNVDKSGALASNKHLGLLGNGVYERFSVIIDFVNNDIYLKPNRKFTDPFEFSRLGFAYVDRNKTLGSWIVTGLFKGSEPENNGLRIDDRILEVNVVSVAMIDYEARKDFFSGLDEVKLLVDRRGEHKEIEFKLKYIQ